MVDLFLLSIAPAAGGALAMRLWLTRQPRLRRWGLAVGQIPLLRRSRRMAVRREVAHG